MRYAFCLVSSLMQVPRHNQAYISYLLGGSTDTSWYLTSRVEKDFRYCIAALRIPLFTLLARVSKPEDCSIVPSNLDLDVVPLATQALAAPNINHVVRNIARQLRNLAVICAHRPRLNRRVQQRDNCAVARCAGPVHRRVRAVERVIGVDAPLVRPCGLADDRILVEGEQVLVLQDVDLLLGEGGQICAHEQRAFHDCPERKVRVLLLEGETVADLRVLASILSLVPLDSGLPQAYRDRCGPRNRSSRARTS